MILFLNGQLFPHSLFSVVGIYPPHCWFGEMMRVAAGRCRRLKSGRVRQRLEARSCGFWWRSSNRRWEDAPTQTQTDKQGREEKHGKQETQEKRGWTVICFSLNILHYDTQSIFCVLIAICAPRSSPKKWSMIYWAVFTIWRSEIETWSQSHHLTWVLWLWHLTNYMKRIWKKKKG